VEIKKEKDDAAADLALIGAAQRSPIPGMQKPARSFSCARRFPTLASAGDSACHAMNMNPKGARGKKRVSRTGKKMSLIAGPFSRASSRRSCQSCCRQSSEPEAAHSACLVTRTEIDRLVKKGLLKPERRHDHDAVEEAVMISPRKH
jgi:hypothetical protein